MYRKSLEIARPYSRIHLTSTKRVCVFRVRLRWLKTLFFAFSSSAHVYVHMSQLYAKPIRIESFSFQTHCVHYVIAVQLSIPPIFAAYSGRLSYMGWTGRVSIIVGEWPRCRFFDWSCFENGDTCTKEAGDNRGLKRSERARSFLAVVVVVRCCFRYGLSLN